MCSKTSRLGDEIFGFGVFFHRFDRIMPPATPMLLLDDLSPFKGADRFGNLRGETGIV
jgi:hypothetical protein